MNEAHYKELLKIAYSQLPEVLYKKERFSIPQVKGRLIKTRTQITNFKEIAKDLVRSEDHLLKFILKEVGVRGDLNFKSDLILHSRFQPAILNKTIEKYYNTYVQCKHCRSPDTEMNDKNTEIKCKACGHQETVSAL